MAMLFESKNLDFRGLEGSFSVFSTLKVVFLSIECKNSQVVENFYCLFFLLDPFCFGNATVCVHVEFCFHQFPDCIFRRSASPSCPQFGK